MGEDINLFQTDKRAVFSAVTVGRCILNEAGEIVDIDRQGLDIMETTWVECMGLQFGDAFHCENSLEHGCGHGGSCRHCPVRNNIEAAIMEDTFSGEFMVLMHSVRHNRAMWIKMGVSQAKGPAGKQIIVTMVDETASREWERQRDATRSERAPGIKSVGKSERPKLHDDEDEVARLMQYCRHKLEASEIGKVLKVEERP